MIHDKIAHCVENSILLLMTSPLRGILHHFCVYTSGHFSASMRIVSTFEQKYDLLGLESDTLCSAFFSEGVLHPFTGQSFPEGHSWISQFTGSFFPSEFNCHSSTCLQTSPLTTSYWQLSWLHPFFLIFMPFLARIYIAMPLLANQLIIIMPYLAQSIAKLMLLLKQMRPPILTHLHPCCVFFFRHCLVIWGIRSIASLHTSVATFPIVLCTHVLVFYVIIFRPQLLCEEIQKKETIRNDYNGQASGSCRVCPALLPCS